MGVHCACDFKIAAGYSQVVLNASIRKIPVEIIPTGWVWLFLPSAVFKSLVTVSKIRQTQSIQILS